MEDELVDEQGIRSARGVYGIAVAAELTGLPAQTLRLYEQKGLVKPARTDGGTRRYSEDDLTVLRHIAELASAGVNLAGIAHVLELEARNTRLETVNERLESDAAARDNALTDQ